jgi:hypothetical protein
VIISGGNTTAVDFTRASHSPQQDIQPA